MIIAQMSNKNNLFTAEYTANTKKIAKENIGSVAGFICQEKLSSSTNLLSFVPGVNRHTSSDTSDQKYTTPECAMEKGADVLIIGRGIINSTNMLEECNIYK